MRLVAARSGYWDTSSASGPSGDSLINKLPMQSTGRRSVFLASHWRCIASSGMPSKTHKEPFENQSISTANISAASVSRCLLCKCTRMVKTPGWLQLVLGLDRTAPCCALALTKLLAKEERESGSLAAPPSFAYALSRRSSAGLPSCAAFTGPARRAPQP
eukprot:6177923-Pleurochrysis_carterae.AAC.1